jgi:hypothetical protein
VSGFYILGGEQQLVPMVEEPYLREVDLQKLLAEYPPLLSGDRGGGERRWLLIERELSLPSDEGGAGRWSLDHLFLDNEAVPTLVEVKRSTDTRIRREVIGQLLDYAANAVTFWPPDSLRAALQQRCEEDGIAEDEAVRELTGRDDTDLDEFWAAVATNLKAGRVRLVFVADLIPSELKRVIEFLNEQMNPAEVIGVEVKQFAGGTFRTLAARMIGVTEQAREQRRVRAPRAGQREWNELAFFTELQNRLGPDAVKVARRLLAWVRSERYAVQWLGGSIDGRMRVGIRTGERGASKVWTPFQLWTDGKIVVLFQLLERRPPFDSERLRRDLLDQLREIEGVDFPDDAIERRPRFPLALLEPENSFGTFTNAIEWVASTVRTATHG